MEAKYDWTPLWDGFLIEHKLYWRLQTNREADDFYVDEIQEFNIFFFCTELIFVR
jgi:hypothetical protein